MLVRVLGEVSLLADDGSDVPLPGSRQPGLLAAFAARPGQLVSASRLVHLLWGNSPPENPSGALHSAVFKLRVNLAKASGHDLLVTREGGYLLDLAPSALDAAEFDRLVESARDLPPAEAAAALARALDLWRGPAYGAFADTEIAQLEALRLEDSAAPRSSAGGWLCSRPTGRRRRCPSWGRSSPSTRCGKPRGSA